MSRYDRDLDFNRNRDNECPQSAIAVAVAMVIWAIGAIFVIGFLLSF